MPLDPFQMAMIQQQLAEAKRNAAPTANTALERVAGLERPTAQALPTVAQAPPVMPGIVRGNFRAPGPGVVPGNYGQGNPLANVAATPASDLTPAQMLMLLTQQQPWESGMGDLGQSGAPVPDVATSNPLAALVDSPAIRALVEGWNSYGSEGGGGGQPEPPPGSMPATSRPASAEAAEAIARLEAATPGGKRTIPQPGQARTVPNAPSFSMGGALDQAMPSAREQQEIQLRPRSSLLPGDPNEILPGSEQPSFASPRGSGMTPEHYAMILQMGLGILDAGSQPGATLGRAGKQALQQQTLQRQRRTEVEERKLKLQERTLLENADQRRLDREQRAQDARLGREERAEATRQASELRRLIIEYQHGDKQAAQELRKAEGQARIDDAAADFLAKRKDSLAPGGFGELTSEQQSQLDQEVVDSYGRSSAAKAARGRQLEGQRQNLLNLVATSRFTTEEATKARVNLQRYFEEQRQRIDEGDDASKVDLSMPDVAKVLGAEFAKVTKRAELPGAGWVNPGDVVRKKADGTFVKVR